MKPIYSLLVSFLLLVALVHAATPPPTNIPISGMPIATNAIDNAYFPMIQPYPGRFTNDNFRITISNMFRGRTSATITNIYANTLVVSNIFATNIYATFVTNNFNNFTNSYITNLFVTNLVTEELTVINNEYVSNLFVTNITIGDPAFFNVNQFSYAPSGDNIVNIKSGPLITNLINVGTITIGGVAYTFDNTLVAGGVLTDPLGNGVLQWTGGTLLWTNNGGIYQTTQGNEVSITNLNTFARLAVGGSLIDDGGYSTNLVAGENDLDTSYRNYIQVIGNDADPTTSSINISSQGPHQNLKIENYLDGSAFTLYNNTVCWNDPFFSIRLVNGDWTPTHKGETIYLWTSGHGDWVELGRYSFNTNSFNPNDPLWMTNVGSASISPKNTGTGFYIDDGARIGIGVVTNIFNGKTFGAFRQVDIEGPEPVFLNTGIANTWPSPTYYSEWWSKITTNEGVQVLVSSSSLGTFEQVWTTANDNPGSFFYYQMLSNSVPTLELDGYTGDIYTLGSITFGPGATNYITRGSSGALGLFNTDSQYSTWEFNSADGLGGYVQGYRNGAYAGVNLFGNDFSTLAWTGGNVTLNTDGFRAGTHNTVDLGTPAIAFRDENLAGTLYVEGYYAGGSDYSRLAVSHSGTNATDEIYLDSQSAGIAGSPKPITIRQNGVSKGEIATGSIISYYTNITSLNNLTGNNDVWTVPSGYRAASFVCLASTTNTLGSSTAYVLLKVSGNYYRIGISGTVTTNTPLPLSFGNSFVFEPGDTFSVNTTRDGLNVRGTFAMIPISSTIKTYRVAPLVSGDNLLFTVPANKTARGSALSGIYTSLPNLTVNWFQDSGGPLVYKGVVSGNTVFEGQSNTTATAGSLNLGTLIAGDTITINSSSSDATQIAYVTVVELPLPLP